MAPVPSRMQFSVGVVDDDDDLRALVRLTLELSSRYHVVGEAPDAETALAVIEAEVPDIVVLDLGLADIAGHELIPRILDIAGDTRVVVFTGTDPQDQHLSRSTGATDYVVKGDIDHLLAALNQIGDRPPTRATRRFAATPPSVPGARQFLADTCRR
ncbi:response regulator transcription factor [Rhabdothermincola sediminis]|uniref:response regulator transcription factor n=1 Tax=Rhabdothermincola sediminis TaxID=2751370 RepID=UPI001AA03311|nr:response regulator [Rhabdothermincola sediminis]